MVVIRLAKGGRVNRSIFTLVAADKRKPRNGRFLEKLGQYDPKASDGTLYKDLKLDRIQAWIGKGAMVSDTVASIIRRYKKQNNS